MPAALSPDLRKRVIGAVEAGSSCRQAAERFGVGEATAIRWYARFRQQGGRRGQADGRRPEFAFHRGARGPDYRGIRSASAGLPARVARHLARAWGADQHERAAPLLRAPRHHPEKGAIHASEQSRPRRDGSAGGLVREPTRFRSRTACLHRRNGSRHQHGTALWKGAKG